MASRLHLLGGGSVDVDQEPEDVARMLWGRNDGDDAHDMGWAALQHASNPILVNPQGVAYVERKRTGRASF